MSEVTEVQNTQAGPEQAAPSPVSRPPVKKNTPGKGRRKIIKRLIALAVVLAIVAGAGFGIWYLVFRDDGAAGAPLTDLSQIGTVQSTVQGYGIAVPKESAAITLSQSGVVQEVYVTSGQTVMAGEPLYTIYSQAAEDAVKAAEDGVIEAQKAVTAAERNVTAAQRAVPAAQETLERLREDLAKLNEDLSELNGDLTEIQDSRKDLTVKAPYNGKIIKHESFTVGKDAAAGAVCTVANDRVLKLPLRFSYAYENDIYVGQPVQVSVPASMQVLEGRVDKINKIEFISTEGGMFFEAVITLNNPGALTEGMTASATMTASDGGSIYPYSDGKLAYSETWDLELKVNGPVLSVDLNDYAPVKAGQVLLTVGDKEIKDKIEAKQEEIANKREEIKAKQKEIKTQEEETIPDAIEGIAAAQEEVEARKQAVVEAQQKVEEARQSLEDFNAVSPIDGQVFSCTITPGQEVKSGDTVITISNTVTMTVEIQVDSRNIGFIQAGMTMELTDDYGNPVMGTVTTVAMEGEVGSGTTTYPVQLEVDNSMGQLFNGSWLNYKLVTAESVDCVYVPNQCVKRVNDLEGNRQSVVFVQAGSRPDNAVELDPESMGDDLPTPEEGFWPVPVTMGLSDTYNCEIVEGLEPDVTVFTGRETSLEDMYG